MFVGAIAMLLYVIGIIAGIALMIFLIVFLCRLLSLKSEQNRLLRELIDTLKEKKE